MASPLRATDLFLPLRLGPTARDTLVEFMDLDVTATDLVTILNRNQAYRDLLFRFISRRASAEKYPGEAAGPNASSSPTHRCVNLLGMIGTRNLIVALRLWRLQEGRFPVNEEGEVEIEVGKVLLCALEAEDSLTRNRMAYPETAFAAGILFDLSRAALLRTKEPKPLEAYLQRVWRRALRTGLLAQTLAELVPGPPPRLALAAGILAHVGKPLLALQAPGYVQYEESLDKAATLPPIARFLMERAHFGITAEEVGAHALRYFEVFPGLVKVVTNYREPHNLKGTDSSAYALSLYVYVADSMARSWKTPSGEQDQVFEEWAHPALAALKIPRATLIEAMQKVMRLR